ncbi:MAG TPA: winged helix DNA-binding domain-containing protein [Chloroflexia bacterium]|nr:winged helix DNA-binding domain-containing protein [Chloroflexia bacterium]
MRAQRLSPRATSTTEVATLVRHLGGVQAQEVPAAALAILARQPGLRASDVEHARVEARSVVRTSILRGTLHLVATDDLGWMLALLGARLAAGDARRRAQLGLDDATADRGVTVICDALAREGPLPRAALAAHLARHGLPSTGQAPAHLVFLAAVQGRICFGPDQGGKPTYVLLDGWVALGPALPRAAAVLRLAQRYLSAYGPAAAEDCAGWAGLPVGDVRAAWRELAGECDAVEIEGRPAMLLREQAAWLDAPGDPEPTVRLVAGYDPYLLGYESRALAVPPEHARRVHPGGGLLHPALLVDGLAAGTWRLKPARAGVEIVVAPFGELMPAVLAGLEAEVADVGAFLEQAATLRVEG